MKSSRGRSFQSFSYQVRSLLSEKLRSPLADRKQPNDSLLGLNDSVFPVVEMYPQRLRKPPHDIEHKRQPFFLLACGRCFLRVVSIFRFFVFDLFTFFLFTFAF